MKLFKVIMILFWVSSLSLLFAQDKYAPWAKLKQDIPDGVRNSYENMKENTPDRSMIELPPYPGAEIIETSQSTQSVDESRNPVLPTVTLISNDPSDKIINVYKDIIKDFPEWHWDSNIRIFYKGNLQDALNRQSPYIQVTPIESGETGLMYVSSDVLASANSKIVVCYNPGSAAEN